MSERTNSVWKSLVFVVLGLVIIGPVAALYLFTGGVVSGQEFNPDDFSRQNFFYNKMPIFGWTIYGLTREPATPVMEQNLVSDGWIKPVGNTRWDLVYDSATNLDRTRDCDARILIAYLDLMTTDNENYWYVWNRDHPNLGPIFWQAVADLARAGQYVDTPDLMRLAMDSESDKIEVFRARMDPLVASSLKTAGIRAQQDGDHRRAVTLFQQSLGYAADAETRQRLQESLDRTGPSSDQ